MSSIKGSPPQGAPPAPPTAPEQADAGDRVNQSGTRPLTARQGAREAAETQVQVGLTDTLLRQKKGQSAADAERLVSQAGYQRTSGKKRDKGFDLGDSTQAPIPLPADDTDAAEWSQGALQEAQEELTRQGSAFMQAAKDLPADADLEVLWQRVVSQSFADTPEHLAKLAEGQAEASTEPTGASLQLAQMQGHAEALFGKTLGNTEPGAALVAAALMVAGASDAVDVVPGAAGGRDTLNATKLAAGVQNVVKGGHTAVEDARKMNQGIDKNLSIHRTFVFKR
jgi:hypothetical protein